MLALAHLDVEGRGEVVARPGQSLRVRIEHEGLVFAPWEGVTPEAGERLAVPMLGARAPAQEGEDGERRP